MARRRKVELFEQIRHPALGLASPQSTRARAKVNPPQHAPFAEDGSSEKRRVPRDPTWWRRRYRQQRFQIADVIPLLLQSASL